MASYDTKRKRQLERKQEGLCIACGNLKREGDWRNFCEDCISKEKLAKDRKQHLNYLNNICNSCSNIRAGNTNLCEYHLVKSIADQTMGLRGITEILLNKLNKQNKLCYYSSKPLFLGVNASLDHKYPTSRFPELKSDIDNVVWCLRSVNSMKSDMTEEEFFDLCESISRNKNV